MRKQFNLKPSVLCAAIASMAALPAVQAGMSFSQAPPIHAARPPAPNVIVSVDDSGSMLGSKMTTLKKALKATFIEANVPYDSIRLGWQSMNAGYAINATGSNAIRVWNGARETAFQAWVDGLAANGWTPSHRMLKHAGEYLQMPKGINSPWAEVPGTKAGEFLSCRRAYTIFLTDGDWNGPDGYPDWTGSHDNVKTTLPDGVVYDPTDAQTAIYTGAQNNRFADLAFKFWSTDLQPDIDDKLAKRIHAPGDTEFETAEGKKAMIGEYWNPRNNPATWQHLEMYAIGFGAAASGWAATPVFGTDTWTGADYNRLIVGKDGDMWGTNYPADMWHAALNTRGQFIGVQHENDLTPAFLQILEDIQTSNELPLTSIALSASTTRYDSAMFTAGYDTGLWTGQVSAYKVDTSGAVDMGGLWGSGVTTATLLDAKTNAAVKTQTGRAVFTYGESGGVPFLWGDLTDGQKTALNANKLGVTDGFGEKRLDYIRGDRTEEGDNKFRIRGSRHGDVVNSQVWRQPGNAHGAKTAKSDRPDMLYVGANDGMLHAFNASTGQERFGYIPAGIVPRLPELTDQSYSHRYYVDGSPFTADVKIGDDWKTYLAGFLGAGGKGYFLLDVTSPQDALDASALVVLDKTLASDDDIGHIFSDPVRDQFYTSRSAQFARLNNGRWALVTGNGYNSANQSAVLIIQYLDGGKEIRRIDTHVADGNGLSAPRLVDLNEDGIPDVAYAGDLKGNLWKFDLADKSDAGWNVAFGGRPLFMPEPAMPVALRSITAAPAYYQLLATDGEGLDLPGVHPGVLVAFGTGQNLTDADRTNVDVQRLYGVRDKTKWQYKVDGDGVPLANSETGDTKLIELDSDDNSVNGIGSLVAFDLAAQTVDGVESYDIGDKSIDWTTRHGWYLPLSASGLEGARATKNITWLVGTTFHAEFYTPTDSTDTEVETCQASFGSPTYFDVVFDIRNPDPSGLGGSSLLYLTDSAVGGIRVRDSSNPQSQLSTPEGEPVCVDAAGLSCDPVGGRANTIGLVPTWRNVQ